MKALSLVLVLVATLAQAQGPATATQVAGAGVTADASNSMRVSVCFVAGQATDVQTKTIVGPLAVTGLSAPTGFLVSGVTGGFVTLSWSAVIPGATVVIHQGVAPATLVPIPGTVTGTTATVPAPNGVLYYYSIQFTLGGTRSSPGVVLPAYASSGVARGDVNGDGAVDGKDLVEMAYRYTRVRAADDPNWLSSADLNNDGVVNAGDLAILKGEIGK